MTRSRQWAALAVLMAVGLVLETPGCGSGDRSSSSNSASSATAASAEVLICGWHPTTDSAGKQTVTPEMYVLPAINNKLRHYPEFAAALKMAPGSVTDCTSARTWYDGYLKYSNAHHRFDLDEPVDGLRTPPPAPPMERPVVMHSAPGQVPKIYQGTPGAGVVPFGGFFPVVNLLGPADQNLVKNVDRVRDLFQMMGLMIDQTDPNALAQCTGTFIAKHWIATAAHCILSQAAWTEVDFDEDAGMPPDQGAVAWLGYYGYTIDWGNTSGTSFYNLGSNDKTSIVRINLLQIPDPTYPGMNPKMGYPEVPTHDFALLYVPADFDGTLPPDAAKSSWAVSLIDPDPSWNLTVWGWGQTTPGVKGNSLNSAPIAPFTFSNTTMDTFNVMGPASASFGGICPGDSGGPWVRRVTSSADGTPQSVIVGVTSITGGGHVCQTMPSDTAEIPSMAHEMNFINQELQWWNGPSFSCIPKISTDSVASGSGQPDYAECFGPTCSSSHDCPDLSYSCVNPSADPGQVVTCTICDFIASEFLGSNPMSGDCSCVQGQCLQHQ